MPWCPKCKTEYREGFDICSDCGETLVSEYPADPNGAEEIEKDGDWEHFIYLFNETEADIVMGLLESADIPVIKMYKGMGILHKVYTGKVSGVDLFVPKEKLEQAKELLRTQTED
jgi:hypothetical protein